MSRTKHRLLLLLALAGGCSSTPPTVPLESASPVGSWSLQSFDLAGGQSVLVPDPESYLLELREDGGAHVRADCNRCNGSYSSSGTNLSMGLLACTRAACPPGSLDTDYLRALGAAASFVTSGSELLVLYPEGALAFRAMIPE